MAVKCILTGQTPDETNLVHKTGNETISGEKTFSAPSNINGTEQATAKFKTSNGGAVVIGKEGGNSGTMLRFEQTEGTTRLKFRSSATPGAMVWEQPEQGAQLYVDLGSKDADGDYRRISFPGSGGTLALQSSVDGKVDKASGKGLSTNDYTTAEKTKLNGIAAGAEVNQNAFSNIAIGDTTIAANAKTDTLTLVAGSNVTLTPDAINDKITIAAKDTTYSTVGTSGNPGLMTAADKVKLNGIATGANKTIVDTTLSSTSTNPVQNKVIQTALTNITSASTLFGKKISIFGDSISAETNDFSWVHSFRSKLGNQCTIVNHAVSGAYAADVLTQVTNVTDKTSDIIIVFVGTNDFRHNTPINSYDTEGSFGYYIKRIYSTLAQNWTSSTNGIPVVYFVSCLPRADSGNTRNEAGMTLLYYNKVIEGYCNKYALPFIDMANCPQACTWSVAYSNSILQDGLHPTIWYSKIICDYIINCISGGTSPKTIPLLTINAKDKLNTNLAASSETSAQINFIGTEMNLKIYLYRITITQNNFVIMTAPELGLPAGMGGNYIPMAVWDSTQARSGLAYINGTTLKGQIDPNALNKVCNIGLELRYKPIWCNQIERY